MRQLVVYTMFITINQASFHLRWKENLVKQKVSKYFKWLYILQLRYFYKLRKSLPSISCQSKIFETALTKLLLKIEVLNLVRCNSFLLMYIGWKVFGCSLKKLFFSKQNRCKWPFTSNGFNFKIVITHYDLRNTYILGADLHR